MSVEMNKNEQTTIKQPTIQIVIDGKEYAFPVSLVGNAMFKTIPAWMRDSSVDPPEVDQQSAKAGLNKGLAIAFRSGFKAMAAPFLPKLYFMMYGQKMKIDRSDSLPVIIGIIINFAIRQMLAHPMEFVTDEDKQTIIGYRPYDQSNGPVRSTESRG